MKQGRTRKILQSLFFLIIAPEQDSIEIQKFLERFLLFFLFLNKTITNLFS